MSNQLAVAAVTATLRKLIEDAIQLDDGSAKVIVRPPDQAEKEKNRLNLFLYHAEVNGATRNWHEWPGTVKLGESAEPPLPLTLFYLLAAYGADTDTGDLTAQRLLGRAMQTLHDHPLLGSDEIKNALPNNDLWEQIERVRLTWQPLSLEESSKLWTSFATKYRLSVAYRVDVVLIESTRPKRTPLPVLTYRTDAGKGLQVQANLIPPYPALTEIVLPTNKRVAEQGDQITLNGFNLKGASLSVQLTHAALAGPLVIPQADFVASGETFITLQLPAAGNAPSDYAAGFYSARVLVNDGTQTRATNAEMLPLGATIKTRAPASAPAGNIAVTVTCVPQVRPEQQVSLLFGEREIAPQPFSVPANPADPSSLQFNIIGAATGQQFLRLRVDGVDSNLIKMSGAPPVPTFDTAQMVTVT